MPFWGWKSCMCLQNIRCSLKCRAVSYTSASWLPFCWSSMFYIHSFFYFKGITKIFVWAYYPWKKLYISRLLWRLKPIVSLQLECLLHISNRCFQDALDFGSLEWCMIYMLSFCHAFLPYCHLWKKTMLLSWTMAFVGFLQHYCLYKKGGQTIRDIQRPDAVNFRPGNFMKSHPVLRSGFGIDVFLSLNYINCFSF